MNRTDMAHIFSLLASETRIRLLEILKDKALACHTPESCNLSERCCNVTELAKELGIAMSTASYNIKELRRCGLVHTQRQGQQIFCSINEKAIEHIIDFFESLAR